MAMSHNIPEKKNVICRGIQDVDYNENNLEIDVIAGFAVDEYNKKENTLMELKKVPKARKQLVEGTMYYIALEVTDGGQKKYNYVAKVWKKLDLSKVLEEFKPLPDAPSDSSA